MLSFQNITRHIYITVTYTYFTNRSLFLGFHFCELDLDYFIITPTPDYHSLHITVSTTLNVYLAQSHLDRTQTIQIQSCSPQLHPHNSR